MTKQSDKPDDEVKFTTEQRLQMYEQLYGLAKGEGVEAQFEGSLARPRGWNRISAFNSRYLRKVQDTLRKQPELVTKAYCDAVKLKCIDMACRAQTQGAKFRYHASSVAAVVSVLLTFGLVGLALHLARTGYPDPLTPMLGAFVSMAVMMGLMSYKTSQWTAAFAFWSVWESIQPVEENYFQARVAYAAILVSPEAAEFRDSLVQRGERLRVAHVNHLKTLARI